MSQERCEGWGVGAEVRGEAFEVAGVTQGKCAE